MQRGSLAADVLADRIDVIGWHVQLVAVLVRQQQVVTLRTTDGTRDHSLVLADAVDVMHDEIAGLQVLEYRRCVAAWRARYAMGTAATGEV